MKTVEMFDVRESAPTKAEAKALVEDTITQAFEGTYTPKLPWFGDFSFLLYRCARGGWQYTILHAPEMVPPIGRYEVQYKHDRSEPPQLFHDSATLKAARRMAEHLRADWREIGFANPVAWIGIYDRRQGCLIEDA